jgi:tetratricopeptide (TPR) repeat protein
MSTELAAFDQLLRAVKGPPPRADLAVQLGLRALEQRREEDALPIVAAAAAHIRDPNLLHILGLLHRAVGDLVPALAALDRALALAPPTARLLHARARATFEAGEPSLDWYARARAIAPLDAELILGQAAALHAARDTSTADALLAATLAQHPGWIDGQAALIRLRHISGRREDSRALLDAAIDRTPRDARLHHMRIVTANRAGEVETALAALAAARAALGEEPMVRAMTAILATEHGHVDEADIAFAAIDPLADEDTAIHWFRHLLRCGDPDRLLGLAPRLAPVLANHAEPYFALARRLVGGAAGEDHVAIVDFGADWPLLAQLADAARALHVAEGQPLDQSVRSGTQTDGPLLWRIDPVIAAARAALSDAVAAYIARLPRAAPGDRFVARAPRHPRFVGSWSVRLGDGGFHEPHVHNEGWLSSALYLALPPLDAARHEGWLTIGEPQGSLGLALGPNRLIEPRPGRLVLFPSTSWHGTRPFGAGERLTIAFDIS